MKKTFIFAQVFLAVFLLGITPAGAVTVSVFDNGSFVDTAGGPYSESDTIQASLIALGHSVTTFTGYSGTDWTAAAAAGDIILIPELESGNLPAALDASARAAIQTAVSLGTGFISICDYNYLMNDVFGYSLTYSSAGTTSLNAANAAGTEFAGGPASLSSWSYTSGMSISTLPTGAVSFYDGGGLSTVFATGYGSGIVGSLGWDWFNAAPLGSVDGGWLAVLDSMVQYTAAAPQAPIPEPTTLVLFGLGLLGLAGAGRKKRLK